MAADEQLPGQVANTNYFVCTLGQAAALNTKTPHSFKTVNDFIDLQAREHPNSPALGFPIPPKDQGTDSEWDFAVYSE